VTTPPPAPPPTRLALRPSRATALALDGRLLATVGRVLERATHPAWAPDGKAVAVAGRRAGEGYDIRLESVPGPKP
jgi:hypothetical protein